MVNIDFHNLSPVVGCPLKSPQGTVLETLTCHIYIYDHIYIEVALGQDCQMYNKLAAPCITNWQHHGSGLPYNISSSERVNEMGKVNNSGYIQHLTLLKLSKCKQHIHVLRRKINILNKWAGLDLVAHMFKGFCLHIAISKMLA